MIIERNSVGYNKIVKVITTCVNQQQLTTTLNWVDDLYKRNLLEYFTVMELISFVSLRIETTKKNTGVLNKGHVNYFI